MRYERKYRVEGKSKTAVLAAILQHPMSFRKQFPDENLIGAPQRRKYRIRWYGTDANKASKPILEIKRKDCELGEKHFAPMEDFDLVNHLDISREIRRQLQAKTFAVEEQKLSLPSKNDLISPPPQGLSKSENTAAAAKTPMPYIPLQPTLLNSYERSYFLSMDRKFRLTIDWNMQFQALDIFFRPGARKETDLAVVVEIKYDAHLDQEYDRVGQDIPFRPSKNSKYVNGMLMVGNV